jgi:hypothetical protein
MRIFPNTSTAPAEWQYMSKRTVGIIATIAILFLAFVWPTPYRIHTHPMGGTYRVNRFTGVTEVSTPLGWKVGTFNSAGRMEFWGADDSQ